MEDPLGSKPIIDIYAGEGSGLESHWDQQRRCATYVWGKAVHPDLASGVPAAWYHDVVERGEWSRFSELLGTFVVIVEDRTSGRLHFISDILGVRPFFIGSCEQGLAFGSDVWGMWEAGLIGDCVDYDSVACWLMYGYNCTNGSLFADCRRLEPGSVLTIDRGKWQVNRYTSVIADDRVQNVPATIHDIVSRTSRLLYANCPTMAVSLSGGFDSRYLLALARRDSGAKPLVTHVRVDRETGVAGRVAAALGLPMDTVPGNAAEYDQYGGSFHFSADGFPVGKQETFLSAARRPGVPLVNGYLGDSLVRGYHDTCFGKYESEFQEPLSRVLQSHHKAIRLELCDDAISDRIAQRALVPLEAACEKGKAIGAVFGWVDLYLRQRCYMSNNFLQHLHLGEAVVPFCSWELINFKLSNPAHLFTWETYTRIFAENFPELAAIPHSSQLGCGAKAASRRQGNRLVRQWAVRMAGRLANKHSLDLLKRDKVMARLAAGTIDRNQEDVVILAYRLSMLEDRTRKAGVDLDWRAL